MSREQAEVTKVEKVGDGYRIAGISRGKKAEFFTDAKSVEHMSRTEAHNFFKRTITNITKHEE